LISKSVIRDDIKLFIPILCEHPDTLIVISHGSSGVGSAEQNIAYQFLTKGYNVAILDYFTKYDIESLGWIDFGPYMDKHSSTFEQMFDIELPEYKNYIHIGCSLGGYYGLYNAQKFIKNYCFYPGIIAVTQELIDKDYSNTKVFIPSGDTWCDNYKDFELMLKNPPEVINVPNAFHGYMLEDKDREILITKYNTTDRILSNEQFSQLRPNHYAFALLYPERVNETIRLKSNKKHATMSLNNIFKELETI
tara:strand:- start:1172 stop:1921 length:750 start_codon:yes stop_codon:yes gene_type:complete